MIKYRRELLKGQTFHKFVINEIRWNNRIAFHDCIIRAREFCQTQIDPDKWSMFNGGETSYTLFLIEDDRDAALFKLSFIMHDYDYKGRVKY